uniref:Uncharacterized protein n=1 Tax=Triticum urartu TaxID=4572 RepID=A0A8R7QP00_TRIUA
APSRIWRRRRRRRPAPPQDTAARLLNTLPTDASTPRSSSAVLAFSPVLVFLCKSLQTTIVSRLRCFSLGL